MARDDKEREALKKSLSEMSTAAKLKYFFSYYTIHTLLVLLALVIGISVLVRVVRKKDVILYVGLTNTAIGSVLEGRLTDGFTEAAGFDRRRVEVVLYKDLYISDNAAGENHEYAYASQLKLMGAINAQKMDMVLMNRESYDVLSGKGYLMDLTVLLADADPALRGILQPGLVENDVILSDNSLETALGEEEEVRIDTEQVTNGIRATDLPVIREAGFPDDVYLGVIANTPRTENALIYLSYLAGGPLY